ncbi:hypothetical protein C2R22_08620 [Salinigranum rubrum]|uniref:Uncharacterized protein n=1 Tax=Salinigranum rubrum TaxID=755307 RepID=A0A2I8VID7_9EURY|nr:DUF5787 family protein [Salinigranum rubrum]AUV81703.1 hypothetical protein C2R22_08620 [Salinigranum rubrum]
MTDLAVDSEFTFELVACRWAEREWPPDGPRADAVLVARQVGTRKRRWDTLVVEADPAGLRGRDLLGPDELDSDLLHVVRHAPAEWAWYRDALPHPGYPWRYVREAIHRAAARDAVETRRRGNRIELRRVAPYPDWISRVVAIENKPDLDASAARALASQIRYDVDCGLLDEVWVATRATDESVPAVLLEEFPVEAGVLAVDPLSGTAEVLWHPSRLSPDDESEDRRTVIAERAYGRGWRSYVDTMRPDCRHFELTEVGGAFVPHCAAKGRCQTNAECAGSCRSFEPEPPGWRTRGWPIEGGPGKGIRSLLERRRERVRGREREEE